MKQVFLVLAGVLLLVGCDEGLRVAEAESAAATWKLVAALALGAGAVIGILVTRQGSDDP